jgi:hypothetical protein
MSGWLNLIRLLAMSTLAAAALPASALSIDPDPGAGGMALEARFQTAVQEIIARELPRFVASADRWEVKVEGIRVGSPAGKLDRVHVAGRNVRTRDGLTIAHVALTLENVTVNPEAGTLDDIGAVNFLGRLDDEAVTRFAHERGGDRAKDLRVDFGERKVVVSCAAGSRPLRVRVRAVGMPAIRNNQVYFELDRVSVARLRMPDGLVRRIDRKINPVFDLRGLNMPGRITRVAVEDKQLVAEARLELREQGPAIE